jgi:hypothetical protein
MNRMIVCTETFFVVGEFMKKRIFIGTCIFVILLFVGIMSQQLLKSETFQLTKHTVKGDALTVHSYELGSETCGIDTANLTPVYASDNYIVSKVASSTSLQIMNLETKKCELETRDSVPITITGVDDKVILTDFNTHTNDFDVKLYDLVTKEEKVLAIVANDKGGVMWSGLPYIVSGNDTVYWIEGERIGEGVFGKVIAYHVKDDKKEIMMERSIDEYIYMMKLLDDTLVISKVENQIVSKEMYVKEKDGELKTVMLSPNGETSPFVYGHYVIHVSAGQIKTTSITSGEVLLRIPNQDNPTISYSEPFVKNEQIIVNEGGTKIVAFDLKDGSRQDLALREQISDIVYNGKHIMFYSYMNGSLTIHTVE